MMVVDSYIKRQRAPRGSWRLASRRCTAVLERSQSQARPGAVLCVTFFITRHQSNLLPRQTQVTRPTCWKDNRLRYTGVD